MFAIFLTPEMDRFYQIVCTFPTVIFSVVLLLCIFYWVLAVLGLVEIDALDFDIPDIDGEGVSLQNDALSNLNVMAGLLVKLGLNGVPFPVVLSFIALLGWAFSFLLVYFIYPLVPGAVLEFLVGFVILVFALYVSALTTARIIKPMRPIFKASNQQYQKQILGQTAVVRTGEVTPEFGEATLEDGGAGLIIKVRSFNNETFHRGDKVVLLEHNKVDNTYKVVSEQDFNG